ncbi:MAG: ABC transporter ATP-binding protein [Acutalibacteraceae bacterium]|nr:ABC transporter ATP-binding protein [Acutalibacteraceae bacterium]
MTKLLKYLKGSRLQCVLAPLFKMFEAILELFVPLVIAEIIDTGIGNSDNGYILKMCGVLVLLGAVGLAFSVTAQFFAAKASVDFVKRLRHALYEHIGRFSYKEVDKSGTSTLITRMTGDMDSVQNGLNLTLRLLLRSPFVVIGAMIMAFTVDSKAAVTFAVVIPLLSIVVFGIMFSCIPLYKKVHAALDKVLCTSRESLTGARVIRAFCKEDEQIEEFRERNDLLTKIQEFTGRISALLNPMTCVIINIGIAVLIYKGAIRVEAGVITQGAVVALYNYMSQILVELVKFASLIISITKSVACAGRISAALETPAERNGGNGLLSDKSENILEFRNVSFAYEGAGDNSLENISFCVKKGETVGIIGSTGSGKTTLVNLIPAFYEASGGEVLAGGVNVNELPLEQLRSKIAVVPQKSVLFKGTIRENMLWGKENATDEEIMKALETAQAAEFVMQKDGGLDAVVEQGGRNFSGGQRQRLAVARAVLKDADILILDDSSSALDYATDAAMRKAIAVSQGDKAVFIVSQRTSSIMHADKIIVLDDGKAEIGTHEELLKNNAVYREIHFSQFDEEESV